MCSPVVCGCVFAQLVPWPVLCVVIVAYVGCGWVGVGV